MRDHDHQRPSSVAARLRGQFAPAYLTLTSIIQGVALSTLVIRVEGMSEHFELANWLLATATMAMSAYGSSSPGWPLSSASSRGARRTPIRKRMRRCSRR